MNKNLKSGDLALVIAGGFSGQIVELIRLVMPGEVVASPTGKLYQFRPALSFEGWLCQYGSGLVMKHERNLMLLGDSATDLIQEQELCRQ